MSIFNSVQLVKLTFRVTFGGVVACNRKRNGKRKGRAGRPETLKIASTQLLKKHRAGRI
jgi:hypothetical protein